MERLNFEGFIYGDSLAQAKKDRQRELIAQHTAEFLERGGEITYLEYDPTAERAARVGRWTDGLGGESLIPEDEDEEFYNPYLGGRGFIIYTLLTRLVQGADALVMSCPLCEYNLGAKQEELLHEKLIVRAIPTSYFTQLIALALGLDRDMCRFDLN